MPAQDFIYLLGHALAKAARRETRAEQRTDLAPLLQAASAYAEEVARGEDTWEPIRQWAAANAQLAIDAQSGFESWSAAIADMFYGGGEEEVEKAFTQQSQLALLCDLFRGTEAEAGLALLDSAEVDEDYRRAAEQFHLEAPSWVPRSHSWWYWRDK